MKLELKHIAPYLPFGLKYFSPAYKAESILDFSKPETIEVMNAISMIAMVRGNGSVPLLRPLSDLTKEIEHNGERFVPMVKLAKLSFSLEYDDYRFRDDWNGRYGVFKMEFRRGNTYYEFKYDSNRQAFKGFTGTNQLECFQMLYSWHFDLNNLIPAGLALPLNKTVNG